MCDNFWQKGKLCDVCMASEWLANPPSQQNYHVPSAPVSLDGDQPFVVPHDYLWHGGDSTGNDDVPAPAHLYDTGFSPSHSRSPSDLTAPFFADDRRGIYIATEQPPHNASFNSARSPFSDDSTASNLGIPGNLSESYPNEGHPDPVYDNPSESHASGHSLVCMWHDDYGLCGKPINEGEIADHLSSSHLPPPSRDTMKCQWQGCKLKKHICRDTIIRHIRQIHLKIRPRRQS